MFTEAPLCISAPGRFCSRCCGPCASSLALWSGAWCPRAVQGALGAGAERGLSAPGPGNEVNE